jgi:hypothetical protein
MSASRASSSLVPPVTGGDNEVPAKRIRDILPSNPASWGDFREIKLLQTISSLSLSLTTFLLLHRKVVDDWLARHRAASSGIPRE